MKRLMILALGCLLVLGAVAQELKSIQEINIRDPYILPDAKSGVYYMYQSSSVPFFWA